MSFTVPPGVIKVGDLMVAQMLAGSSGNSYPAGFTQIVAVTGELSYSYKVATSDDVAGGTYSSASTASYSGGILRIYRGASYAGYGYRNSLTNITSTTTVGGGTGSAFTTNNGSNITTNHRQVIFMDAYDGSGGQRSWQMITKPVDGISGSLTQIDSSDRPLSVYDRDMGPLNIGSGTFYGWQSVSNMSTSQPSPFGYITVIALTPNSPNALLDPDYWLKLSSFDSGMLAYTERDSTITTGWYSVATTWADIDATNLAITFTAPTSGRVTVNLSAFLSFSTNSIVWGLRDTSGTHVVNPKMIQRGTLASRGYASFYITGLTPGQSYTYRWAWRSPGGSSGMAMYSGGEGDPTLDTTATVYGPATMEVWPA